MCIAIGAGFRIYVFRCVLDPFFFGLRYSGVGVFLLFMRRSVFLYGVSAQNYFSAVFFRRVRCWVAFSFFPCLPAAHRFCSFIV
jgi:hypothetical protein